MHCTARRTSSGCPLTEQRDKAAPQSQCDQASILACNEYELPTLPCSFEPVPQTTLFGNHTRAFEGSGLLGMAQVGCSPALQGSEHRTGLPLMQLPASHVGDPVAIERQACILIQQPYSIEEPGASRSLWSCATESPSFSCLRLPNPRNVVLLSLPAITSQQTSPQAGCPAICFQAVGGAVWLRAAGQMKDVSTITCLLQ